MGKSLFEFSKDKRNTSPNLKEQKAQKPNLDEDEVKKKIKNYSKLSENELMNELYKEVGKQKSGGDFDINKLASQLDSIKPMLNEKQNANLQKIFKNLK